MAQAPETSDFTSIKLRIKTALNQDPDIPMSKYFIQA
ncbi:hypothetical protein KT99_09658 [Shewanella benthica KT99]|uniref:Uncharacterized protein n=1 Tax=Shewanella benthica KT99 TaxID=314608 RepID=A9DDK7_9GAMM|nr:hypothetical protein KT99_09658 [Shewanella benthica KT99]